MPSAKIASPANGATIPSGQTFTFQIKVKNLATGQFVNAQKNYFAAPQQLNANGIILGHSHIVVEKLTSKAQTEPTNPTVFQFFKGLNDQAVNGVLTTAVTGGLPPGSYRACTINSSSNHQPAIAPVAQHGSLDDCSYFDATPGGAAAPGQNTGGQNTGGQNTGGQNTGGQNTGGQNTGGQNTGGRTGGGGGGGRRGGR